jgi:crotonobetainyl-CoA:carnitine CoA-transferase CaiB-like acyl-CoA transferase
MKGPLDGYRVIDMSSVVSGPLATMMLSDQGAEVIKVETIGAGDTMRTAVNYRAGMSALFANCNRGKRSIALNLKDPRGRAIVLELIRDADVFVENWRPGAADRLGLGDTDLRAEQPDLIYTSITGYGTEGPYRDQRVYDPVIQAYVGMIAAQRNPETASMDLVRNIVADKATSYTVVQAITAALLARERGHGGQHIDVSMLNSTLAFFWPDGMMEYTMTGANVEQPFTVSDMNRLWSTSDGHVIAFFQSRAEMKALAVALEHPEWIEDETFMDNVKRFHPDNLTRVYQTIQAVMGDLTTAEIVRRLIAEDVPVAPVLEQAEVFSDPQILAMGSVIDRHSTRYGSYRQARAGAHFSKSVHREHRHPPLLGEHGDEILSELGYSAERISRLHADQVVGQRPAS